MPVTVRFYLKDRDAQGDRLPVTAQMLDEELCAHFGVESHEDNWYLNWHNYIGFGLALGLSFDEIRKATRKNVERSHKDGDVVSAHVNVISIAICDWLEAHVDVDAYR